MSESNCPICYASLETRDVTPCWDCGANPIELNHLAEGRHKYAEFLVFDTTIILCSSVRWFRLVCSRLLRTEASGSLRKGNDVRPRRFRRAGQQGQILRKLW